MAKATEVEIFVAFQDKNRGFGYNKHIPWPHLKGDHDFYINQSTTCKDPNKKCGYIMGRNCWQEWSDGDKCNPRIFTIVTSTTLKLDSSPFLQNVLPTLDDAITYLTSPPVSDQIEKVCIMGGERNYTAAIDDPRLKRIWVTRVFADYPVDAFFPRFEHKFMRVKCDSLAEGIQEDNGIQYQFELWERFTD